MLLIINSGMKAAIPNALTLSNLFFGAVAALCLIYGQLEAAIWLVGAAVLADFMDGALARWLKVSSPLGRELDSLADVVSFGVVPGIIFYGLIAAASTDGSWPSELNVAGLPAFALSAFAALRLGRFNLDERQHSDFIGLPTPALTLFSIGLLFWFQEKTMPELLQAPVLYAVVALLSWLMNAELPMFSFKFKNLRWKGNEIKYIFAVLSLLLLLVFKSQAVAGIVILYIGISASLIFVKGKKRI